MTTLELPAEPEPISLELDRTALIVVDMQNAFASRGGMLDLAGIDVTPAGEAVANARLVCEAARSADIHKATIYNVKTFFGWVVNSEDVATALREAVRPRP